MTPSEIVRARSEEFDKKFRVSYHKKVKGAFFTYNEDAESIKSFSNQTIIAVLEAVKEKVENEKSANAENNSLSVSERFAVNDCLADIASFLTEEINKMQSKVNN